ncbi:MFS transporter [Streptomyces cacaoi]|uniref:MFS transporter n=1 Tax=Streptomyces cacaoi TaxID=1898 RepID=UPI00374A5D66
MSAASRRAGRHSTSPPVPAVHAGFPRGHGDDLRLGPAGRLDRCDGHPPGSDGPGPGHAGSFAHGGGLRRVRAGDTGGPGHGEGVEPGGDGADSGGGSSAGIGSPVGTGAPSGDGAPYGPGVVLPGRAERPGARREFRALRRPRLLVTLVLGALVNGATFCTFTYLAPLLTRTAGFDEDRVPLLLALFGLGSFAGVTLAGRLADTRPTPLLLGGGTALLAGWAVFALTAGNPVAAAVCVLVQGTLSFAVGSTLIARSLSAATEAPTLAGGFSTAALNTGAALGPWAGGLALDAGLGYRAPLWVSALLVTAAFATAGTAVALTRVRARRPFRRGQRPAPGTACDEGADRETGRARETRSARESGGARKSGGARERA